MDAQHVANLHGEDNLQKRTVPSDKVARIPMLRMKRPAKKFLKSASLHTKTNLISSHEKKIKKNVLNTTIERKDFDL